MREASGESSQLREPENLLHAEHDHRVAKETQGPLSGIGDGAAGAKNKRVDPHCALPASVHNHPARKNSRHQNTYEICHIAHCALCQRLTFVQSSR